MNNYLDLLELTTRRKWDKTALCDRGGASYTYSQMADRIAMIHSLFEGAGVTRGDKVAVCGKNGAHWAMSFIATNAYGAVVVPLLNDFHPESVAQLADHSESKVLFVDGDIWAKVRTFSATKARAVVSLNDFSLLQCSDTDVRSGIERAQVAYRDKYPSGITPQDISYSNCSLDDLAIINYTSGTTSAPKGVMLKNRSLSSNIQFIIDNIHGEEDDKVLSMLPMAHMYGMAVEFLFPVCAGYQLHFLGKTPSPRILLDALADVKPFMLVSVPLVMEKIFYSSVFPVLKKTLAKGLVKVPVVSSLIYRKIYDKLMGVFGGRVKHIILGGAPLNEAVEKVMHKVGLPYCVGYGMTECAPLISYENFAKFVPRSCGKPVDRMEVRIDSPDALNVAGEIQVRGENVMIGYYKNKDATENAFTPDGWLRTGDMGVMDKDMNIFIKGRCKNMILTGNGQNIYPEEIEDKLNSDPYIVESLIVERSSKLVALIFPDTDRIMKDSDLKGTDAEETVRESLKKVVVQVNTQLPSYSQIAKIEVMPVEFEKTPKKSIKRFLYE